MTLAGGEGATIIDAESARRIRERIDDLWSDSISPKTSTETSLKSPGTYSTTASRVVLRSRSVADIRKAKGSPLSADFEILGVLGEGGMGVVYEARQASVDRNIAIKMIKPKSAGDPQARTALLSEASVTGNLDHPNIVPIHDLGMSEDGTLFYAMRKVEGTPWKNVMAEKDLQQNLEILMRVADAVAFAHSRGVIHRDLKPDNVMLGEYGEVLVMDWGLAASVAEGGKAEPISNLSASGGTPCYMAPEMAAGDPERIGKHSDIYLLGAILYKLVTGLTPHHGDSVLQCLMNAAQNRIQPAPVKCELVDIARKAMATEPADRYATVRDFQNAIREYLSHFESINLAGLAREALERARASGDYDLYNQALYGLRESLELWRGNVEAAAGLSEVQIAYARCALERTDLDLAHSVLDETNSAHASLIADIETAQAAARARRRRLRMMTLSVIGTAAALFVAISAGLYFVNQQRVRAEDAESKEKQAHQNTEQALEQVRQEKENTATERDRAIVAETRAMEAYTKAEQALAMVLREQVKARHGETERAKTEKEIERIREALLQEKRLVQTSLATLDPAEAKKHQAQAAEKLGMPVELKIRLAPNIDLTLALIPSGEFIMGSPPGEEERQPQEYLHRVQFTEPFYMGACEVTQAQWLAITGTNPSSFQGDRFSLAHPVENITRDAVERDFLPKLGGSSAADLAATSWFCANGDRASHPVAQHAPNVWGRHDMLGNVAEWCEDVYAEDFYISSPPRQPLSRQGDDPQRVVIRGGSWINLPKHCRAAYRSWTRRDRAYAFLGFRVVCVPQAQR